MARLNNSGYLQWNLFLGSPLGDSGQGIALSGNDELAVVGTSRAPWGPMERGYAGGEDGFLVRFTSPVFLPIIRK